MAGMEEITQTIHKKWLELKTEDAQYKHAAVEIFNLPYDPLYGKLKYKKDGQDIIENLPPYIRSAFAVKTAMAEKGWACTVEDCPRSRLSIVSFMKTGVKASAPAMPAEKGIYVAALIALQTEKSAAA